MKRYKIVAELELSNDYNPIRNLITSIEEHLGIRVVTCNWEVLDQKEEQKRVLLLTNRNYNIL